MEQPRAKRPEDHIWKNLNYRQMKQFFAIWDKALKSYGVEQKYNFVEKWEKVMKASGVEQFKAFSELMKQYSDSWQNLGKNNS